MTEQEAKTKWCPAARVGSSVSGLGGFNRFVSKSDSDNLALCIGSACMAWRWNGNRTEYDADLKAMHPEIGFCGLAGKP